MNLNIAFSVVFLADNVSLSLAEGQLESTFGGNIEAAQAFMGYAFEGIFAAKRIIESGNDNHIQSTFPLANPGESVEDYLTRMGLLNIEVSDTESLLRNRSVWPRPAADGVTVLAHVAELHSLGWVNAQISDFWNSQDPSVPSENGVWYASQSAFGPPGPQIVANPPTTFVPSS